MSRHFSVATIIALSVLAAPLAAQSTSPDTTLNTTPVVANAALFAPSLIGERDLLVAPKAAIAPIEMRARATNVAAARSDDSPHVSRNPAMMIVGGAAIIVGALVGGNGGGAIAVGGGVLGLVGLWNYLK